MPGVPAILRLALGERVEVVFASQRVLPAKAEKLGYRFQHTNVEEALRSLLVS
jgi:NAD dependent epimerase/dehydratase family enzyme